MKEKSNIPQDIQPIQVAHTVHAPIEKVWEAITLPDVMRKWYFDVDVDKIEDGTVFRFYEPGDKKEFLHECLVLEMEASNHIRHTWTYPDISQGSSTVIWDLESKDDTTEVIVTHESTHDLYDGGDALAKANFLQGWTEIITKNLPAFLENN